MRSRSLPLIQSGGWGGAVVLAAGVLISGCTEVEKKYGRRHVTLPATLAGQPSTQEDRGGFYKPDGAVRTAAPARDALARPEYFYGSGRIVADPLGAQGVTPAGNGDGVSLNFVGTSILEVVDVTLGQTLGKNYVIDSRVQGNVTARTSTPIPRASVLPVLENILALNGAGLVEANGVYNIVPIETIATLPSVVVTPSRHPQRPGMGVHIIPLRAVSVDSVKDILAAQVSPGNQLAVDRARNILIFTGLAREANAIIDMVSVLDVDVLAGTSFALFPVQNSNAADVLDELELIFAGEGAQSAVRFVPIERMNAILAVSAVADNLRHVGDWVARLDRSDAAAGRQVFVYYARNSQATELADTLNEVFGGAGAETAARRPRSPVAPGLDAVQVIAPGEAAGGGSAPAGEAAPAPRARDPITVSSPSGGPAAADGLRIVASDSKNAVVVIGTADEFRLIEATLRQLDTQPLQVLIEATIAEVTLTNGLEYGLRWAFETGDLSGSFTNNPLGLVAPTFPGFNLVLDASDVQSVLSALTEVTDVEVISSPQLMVLDNQTARLQVGDQVPVATRTAESTTDADARIVSTIEYFDTGVILEVTPRVNATGLVTLDILQEVSDAVATLTSGIDSPTIQQRSVRSVVAVQSGETVALGGLIRERSGTSVSGIPLLSDIPVVGNLFKTTGQDSQRAELLVLITPRVVRGPDQAREVTDELRRRLTILSNVVAAPQ